jgi:endonuclease YncB( thermonuclease family)
MGNRRKWYSILVIGLILLLAIPPLTGCAESYTEDDLNSAYQQGYDEGYSLGQQEGFNEGYSSGRTKGYNEGLADGLARYEPELDEEEAPEQQSELVEAQVTRVIDGDTIEVDIQSQSYRVRYIGIDTPEVGQPCSEEATQKNRELVEGKLVWLEKDISETDIYGRLLRYVYVDVERIVSLGIDISEYGTSLEEIRRLARDIAQNKQVVMERVFVNAELVRLGWATVATYPPDVKYVDLFLQLQREAEETGRGCWVTEAGETGQTEHDVSDFFIEVVSLTTPVRPGAYATIEVRTLPNELLAIEVYYESGKSEAEGLVPRRADDEGYVWWTWKVGTNTTPGRWQIVIASLNMDWWFKGYENITKTVYFEVR